jgi:hypothetical protein
VIPARSGVPEPAWSLVSRRLRAEGDSMRRLLTAALAAAVLVPSAAAAEAAVPRDGSYVASTVQRGYDLTFTVRKGTIRNVVAHVLETCDGSSTSSTATVGPGLSWRVVKGRFSGRKKEVAHGVTVYTTFEGRFTSRSTVTGVIRQESIVAGSVCDTYRLRFSARRR